MQCPACTEKRTHLYTLKNGYHLYRCRACGSIFVHPFPISTEPIYTQNYFCGGGQCGGYTNYDDDKKAMQGSLVRILKKLEACMGGHAGTLLDVGAATGVFLEHARDRGWHVSGTEISPYAVEAAKRKGLEVVWGDAAAVTAPPESYDIVTFLDVIEHLANPRENLRAARQLLKPQGILALITPNASSVWAKLVGKAWHLLNPPEHLVCYSKKGFATLLGSEGFHIEFVGVPDKWFSVPYICHIIGSRFGVPVLAKLGKFFDHSLLRRISIPLNVRDNMFIIARKK